MIDMADVSVSWDTVRNYNTIYLRSESEALLSFGRTTPSWDYIPPWSMLKSWTAISTAGAKMVGCPTVEPTIFPVGRRAVSTCPGFLT